MARTLTPIKPGAYNWLNYNHNLYRLVLLPLFSETSKRIHAAHQDYNAIRQAIRNIPQDPSMAGLVGGAAKIQAAYLKKKHTLEFERSMRRHFGVRYRITDNARVDAAMQKFIKDNVSLIKTIPPRLHAGLERELIKLTQQAPFDRQALAKVLRQQYNSSGYNLRRITRDQTSKAVGNLTHIRQTDVGITEYFWRTSADERVRETHRRNGGLRFKWATPPATGHPGHDIQCRCHAEGILPPAPRKNYSKTS